MKLLIADFWREPDWRLRRKPTGVSAAKGKRRRRGARAAANEDGRHSDRSATPRVFDLSLSPFPVLDIERGRIPSINPSLIIEQRIVAHQKPAILTVLTPSALLIFEL